MEKMSNIQILKQELSNYGIFNCNELCYNFDYNQLLKEETSANLTDLERGIITQSGAIAVNTGFYTSRSPLDRYVVRDNKTYDTIWWSSQNKKNNSNNHPINQHVWNHFKNIISLQLSNKRLYIVDAFCGARMNHCLRIRFITEIAWQAHFITNMFILPDKKELYIFNPNFIVLISSKCINTKWKDQNLHSENFIALNLTENMYLIGGTWYSGEIKKGLFSVMNYLLPFKNIASMHCAANVGINNDVALFFGLSGTGKTTLSTDVKRSLIGDDEHGWDDFGIFNFEGGCYAKTINLSDKTEPEIFQAIKKNALLENVKVSVNGVVDYNNTDKTENARVSYPIYHIENIVKPISCSKHPKIIFFLTADAFGVLPLVSKLSLNQIQYYFLSGFTTKLSGTEQGVITSTPIFSACFGSPFLTLHPMVYSNILIKKIISSKTSVFLINTGWDGSGKRISLKITRKIIHVILNNENDSIKYTKLPIFNLFIPITLNDINNIILDPRNSFCDKKLWEDRANALAKLFICNFTKFTKLPIGKMLLSAGPQC